MMIVAGLAIENSAGARLTLLVLGSALLVVAVFWFMWRLPQRGDLLAGWAAPLALLSAWGGVVSAVATTLLWLLPSPDLWLAIVFLLAYPATIGAGVFVLWIHRGDEVTQQTIYLQRLQARVGIILGVAAVCMGYVFVMTHKEILTPVGT